MTRYEISAAHLYFLAGLVAGLGTNLITSVISGSGRNFDSLVLLIIGGVITVLSYVMSRLAAVFDHYERAYERCNPDQLTQDEREEIWCSLAEKRSTEISQYRVGLLVPSSFLVVIIFAREIYAWVG